MDIATIQHKVRCSTLETTLGQMAPLKSGHLLECYLNQVALPESRLNICHQLDSGAECPYVSPHLALWREPVVFDNLLNPVVHPD